MASKVAVVLVMFYLSGFTCGIRLDGNGYTDILIAINPAVTEDPLLLERIKEILSDASSYLFQVMNNKLYFKDVTILVPPKWTGKYSRANTETYEKANIIIDEPNKFNGNDPYTLQYGECGTEGRYIRLTPDFLKRDELIQFYGPRGRVLVHEWAHLRWGVYDEYDERKPFYTDNGKLEATRCTKNMTGEWRSIPSGAMCTPTNINGKPYDCYFIPHKSQTTKTSIMYLQSIDSVVQFCNKKNHNTKAPNMQNRMCGGRSVEEVIFSSSVDSQYIPSSSLPSPSPEPTFSVVQRQQRVVCLVLDVSGSMGGQRIVRQRQAASLFLKQIIEDQSYVGIVTFHSTASVLKPLTLIDNLKTREKLADSLPTNPNGGTEICQGLYKGLEVLRMNGGFSNGKEIIFLTDGESNSPINCVNNAIASGATVHTISFGPSGDKLMEEMSEKTGGKFFYAGDTLNSNELVDVFASLTTYDGDPTQQTIQLESLGFTVSGSGLFSGTVSIDKTIGNYTAFLILYEHSPPPTILLIRFTCGIRLDGNGYTDILIAINPAVTEDPLLLERIKVLRMNGGFSNGKEIIFLTDGESNSPINCVNNAIASGATVHTISFGPSGDKLMEEMSEKTGGKFFYAGDTLNSNELVDVFASLTTYDGDPTQQTIQLESLGFTVSGSGLFSGTVSIDKTIGNYTAFLILYEHSPPPTILVESPSGQKYNTFKTDPQGNSLTLNIPGTAEKGKWTYTITSNGQAQTMSITVTSRPVSADVPPVTVKTHMNQQSSNGAKPMVVFAAVSQNGLPVILADVRATLESDAGDKQEMDLLDNGAGADAFRNDGIYSRYFTRMKGGKYNLKVRVQNGYGKARFSLKRHSGAMYIPGYVVDGKLELNPPKTSVGEEDPKADVGNFSRTAIGVSFTVNLPPGVPTMTKFPPNTIKDLNAELVKNRVLLIWTAPGEDLDQGTASKYDIRYSEDPDVLRSNFNNAHPVNSSNLLPSESGSSEQLSFTPTMRNGTTLFFAIKAVDNDILSSETSNLAQVTKVIGYIESPGNGVNMIAIYISIAMVAIVGGLIVGVTMTARKRKRTLQINPPVVFRSKITGHSIEWVRLY
ncbi:calcium-activated chloride channel regulator 3A-1-like [Osmerus mordax]|uniref:calcium-activated chloride channel regulator 3A-1-like n=1 Tax=Osmerus mordax TaxID=8014 RepID=UPI00350EDC6C